MHVFILGETFGHSSQLVISCDGCSRIRYYRRALGRNGAFEDGAKATAADDFAFISCRWDFSRPLFLGGALDQDPNMPRAAPNNAA